MTQPEIDIVVLWVDDSDPEWQRQKQYYRHQESSDENLQRATESNRFRDWGLLRYWFRGVERYMPWVRTVHFVTCGHLPAWLNTQHPKLHLVKHSDYIPADCLPTFSSRSIEVGIHRIPGLAEHFIFFNDDFYVIRPMQPTDFFRQGLPCDMAILSPSFANLEGCCQLCDIETLNRHFRKHQVVKARPFQWFHPSYGKYLWMNFALMPTYDFFGFKCFHQPQSFLKSTFEAVWQAEPELLLQQQHQRFRRVYDTNQYLMRYWQFATGNFQPANIYSRSMFYGIRDWCLPEIDRIIRRQTHSILVLNDEEDTPFEQAQPLLQAAFESILPGKSAFEL